MTQLNLGVDELRAFVPARDFTLFDPSGVLWRIGQNPPPQG